MNQLQEVKKIKKLLSAALIITLIITALLFLFYHNKSDYTSVFFSLDTVVSVSLSEDFTDEVRETVDDLSEMFDNYDENSEISLLNQKKKLTCSKELSELIRQTENLRRLYGKSVNISTGRLTKLWNESLEKGSIPKESTIMKYINDTSDDNIIISENTITLLNDITIEPGAVAKGYVLDKLMNLCKEHNPEKAVISLGSSTLLYSSEKSKSFNVAIKADRESIAGTAETQKSFVSTSGDYERFTEIDGKKYHHIIDPKTGFPSETGLSSVTVFCDSGIASDFLSTLIFIEGKENLKKHLSSDIYEIVAIDTDGNIYHSNSLKFTANKPKGANVCEN